MPALPHSEVDVRDFYKYIEQSLPEPRRMKQLLTWCGSRALPDKPSGDVKNANAIMAARAIQQELIDDFASKPELSDWFSRVGFTIHRKSDMEANIGVGRNCAATRGEEAKPTEREERGYATRIRRRSQKVCKRPWDLVKSTLTSRQTRRGESRLGSLSIVLII
jgi:hypothetical protein